MKTGNGKAGLSATAALSALVCYTAFPERRREKIRNADTIAGETLHRAGEFGSLDGLASKDLNTLYSYVIQKCREFQRENSRVERGWARSRLYRSRFLQVSCRVALFLRSTF